MSLKATLLKAYFKVENAWYAALDFLDKKAHLPVYKLLIDPVERMGVPSFLFYLAVAVIAFGALFFLSAGGGAESASFSILVKMGEDSVSGATVAIEAEGGISFSETTSAAGLAKFDNLPFLEGMTLTISKDGKTLYSRKFDPRRERRTIRIDLAAEAAAACKIVVSSAFGPVEGAAVSYSSESASGTAYSDASGEAPIPAQDGETVTYTVSKEGFSEGSGSFVAERGKIVAVILESLSGTPPPIPQADLETLGEQQNARSEFGMVTVRVKDKETKKGIDARVKLRRVEDNSLINESFADKGVAIFDKVKVNTRVYAFASATNYIYDISGNVTVEESTDIDILLEKLPLPGNASNMSLTNVVVVDSNGSQGIVGANVSVFMSPDASAPLSSYALLDDFATGTGGKVTLTLMKGETYYAAVSATGYFAESAGPFSAGQNQQVSLTRISAETTAALNVTVYKPGGNETVAGARVTLKNLAGAQIAQTTANSAGMAVFSLLRLGTFVTILATADLTTAGTWSGEATSNLSANSNAVSVILSPPVGTLVVSAVNFTNPSQAVPASFSAMQNGVVVGSCNVTTSCNMTFMAGTDTQVTAFPAAPSLAPNAKTLQVSKDQVSTETIRIYSDSDICTCGDECGFNPTASDPTRFFAAPVCVRLLGPPTIRDERGYQVETMQFGKIYSLEFRVAVKGAHTTGLYVRVGDMASTGEDFAFLTGADLSNLDRSRIFAIRASQYYHDPVNYEAEAEQYCSSYPYLDLVNQNRIVYEEANAFKWLEIEVANDQATAAGGLQTVVIPFKQIVFIPKGVYPDTISVYYRAWARRSANSTGGTTGDLQQYYKRVPYDGEVGFAEVYNSTLDLGAWAAGETPSPAPP